MATLEQVMPTLEAAAKAQFPNIDLQDNTVEKDVFLKSPAILVDSEDKFQQFATRTSTAASFRALLDDTTFINDNLPAIFNVPTVDQALVLLSAQVDLFAANYGIFRNGGASAAGTITLIFSSGAIVSVIAGTVFQTSSTSFPVLFVSLSTFSGTPVLVGGIFQSVVPVQAVAVGVVGNIPAHNVTSTTGGISGLVSVDNTQDMAGGVDQETDASVLDRVVAAFQGTSIDTVGGVGNVVLKAGAFDAKVFRVGDPETRNRPGPDVLVVSEEADLVTDTFVFEPVDQAGYIPAVQPLNTLDVGVLSIAGHPSCQFLVIPDTSVNERSSRAQDRVVFFGTDVPVVGETVQFTYAANRQIGQFQALYSPPNPQLFFDVLVKTAIRVDVAISMNVVLFTGVDSSAVTPLIQSAVLSLVNGLKMGQELDQSSVIAVVEAVSGVQRVNLPLNFFGLAGTSGRVVENLIPAATTQYLRLTSANLLLSVV